MKVIKLCDFGSATTEVFRPNPDWSMKQRTALEEDMAEHTTPMYRAPEMLDTWSNYPVDTAADVWALGCLLYTLCFGQHPFPDGAKLAIVNGSFRLPPTPPAPAASSSSDPGSHANEFRLFHDLIRQMLTVDPTLRPSCPQILEHLTSVCLAHGIDPTEEDLGLGGDLGRPNLDGGALRLLPAGSSPSDAAEAAAGASSPTATMTASLMSSIKGGAGSLMRNIRDKSQTVIQTVVQHSLVAAAATAATSAGSKDLLDMHLITERVAAMSYPAEGLESAGYYYAKSSADEVSAIMESRHPGRYMVLNLTERRYHQGSTSPTAAAAPTAATATPCIRFASGVVCHEGWKTNGGSPTPLSTVMATISKCLQFLERDARHVLLIHCLDGKSNTAVLVAALLMACGFVNNFR